MAEEKRIHELVTTTTKSGRFIAIDEAGLSEALKFSLDSFIDQSLTDTLYVKLSGAETVNGVKTWVNKGIFQSGLDVDYINDGGGNLGIGTTTPSKQLTIENAAYNGQLEIKRTLGGSLFLAPDTGSGTNLNRFISTNGYYFETETQSPALLIEPSGNVGIGTTNPESRLTVLSNVSNNEVARFSGSTSSRGLRISTFLEGGTNETGVDFNAVGAGGNAAITLSTLSLPRLKIDQNGNVGIGTTTPSGKLDIIKDAPLSGSIGTTESAIILRANVTSSNATMRLGLSDTAKIGVIQMQETTTATKLPLCLQPFGGNVGIGTTTPNGLLEIKGVGSSNEMFRIQTTGGGGFLIGAEDNTADPTWIIGTNFQEHLLFRQGGADGLFLESGGNVGIGTSTPDGKLDVDGITYFKGTLNVGPDSDTKGIVSWGSNGLVVRGQTGYGLSLGANNTSDRMFISTSGNVGIGTTTPSLGLHIYHPTNNGLFLLESGDSGVLFYMKDNTTSGSGFFANRVANSTYFYTDDVERLTLLTGGNVGIGTTTPSYKLEVNGTIKSLGRATTGEFSSASATDGAIFTAMSPSIPNTGNKIIISGQAFSGGKYITFSYAERYIINGIRLHGFDSDGLLAAINLISGGTSGQNISLAW